MYTALPDCQYIYLATPAMTLYIHIHDNEHDGRPEQPHLRTWPGQEFASHDTVNHQKEEYVRRDRSTGRMASTNAVEGYFGNFRRQVDGTHHHVSSGHLPRYSNEFEFKYNTRKITDGQRTVQTIRRLENRRLTLYKIAEHIPSLQDTRESR
jgi:hypothetical protein